MESHVSVIPTPQADVAPEDSLDLLNPPSTMASGYLTCDSHANSDYDDTDGEAGAYTDGEAEDAYDQPGLARSSEPAQLPLSHALDSSEPAQLTPSHSQSEQVGSPRLVQGSGGAEEGGTVPGSGVEFPSLWHRQGVTSGCCSVQLCVCAPRGVQGKTPQAGAQPLPCP